MNSKIKILLVDDDEDDFILTKDILRDGVNNQNYQVSWCSNFSEAINAMLKSQYDLYLVDYRLGKESGIDLLNEAIKSNCTEPIIILTSKGDLKIDQEAMRLGAADYLVKDSLNSPTLERAIRYAVSHNQTFQKLKISENKFRIIFERSKDPMLITNPAGQIIEANASSILFFETTLEELLKVNTASLYKNKEDRIAYSKTMNAEGSVTDLEIEVLTLNGKTKFCSISSFLQVSQHANEELYYSILHDLTYRISQEKDLASGEKLAATERMAKSLSKEIQNPLSNVNLAIDQLSDTLTNEDDLALADIIKSNCERINALTTELLESTEASYLKLIDTDLYLLLKDLLEEVQQDLDLKVTNPLTEPGIIIKADSENLKTALKNIIKNAAEVLNSENGLVQLTVEKHASGIKINVKDNGTGIAAENLDKLFEPFFTSKAKSTGLGLTRAQRIVNAHHGKIRITTESGTGTTVSVQLPL